MSPLAPRHSRTVVYFAVGRTCDARKKILAAAQSLIELRGYPALGVAEICKAAEVPKGSFYYFFESKEALALTVLDEHWAAERRGWISLLGDDTEPPLQRLRRLFDVTEAQQRAGRENRGSIAGCMLGNLFPERGGRASARPGIGVSGPLPSSVKSSAKRPRPVTVTVVHRSRTTVTGISPAEAGEVLSWRAAERGPWPTPPPGPAW
ncbi:TetR family transcriptional regulator [Streptomyces sp. Ru62]|uniref:TetR/AcrR family transcriptional regulator n=1 Tax=Streptomyces sp. Ru62 TaxID=2080745 RepID=UPI000CDD2A7A|nr:TetR/AcrR family transcriptional regulator [Streptomyces sp. Ru62]POX58794.1 TetR family transcriptional regulator [Streptomyces sp. Ru62]